MAQNNKPLAKVFHYDLFGKRDEKYDFLNENSIGSIDWKELETKEPNFFFVKKDFKGEEIYEKGFKIDELYSVYNNGIETGKDLFFYSKSKNELIQKIRFSFLNKDEAIKEYTITNTSSFRFLEKFNIASFDEEKIRFINYRPFDIVPGYYDEKLQRRPAISTMRNLFMDNLGLLVPRQVSDDFKHVFISKYPSDCNLTGTAKKFGSAPIFPLYLYPEPNNQQPIKQPTERTPNLNPEIVNRIAKKLGLEFVNEKNTSTSPGVTETFAPIDILDYIYAILHSPTYREKYKEFLKIDFPSVPYPKNAATFWQLIKLGGEIRQIHLLESPKVEAFITSYPQDGDNRITRKLNKNDWEIRGKISNLPGFQNLEGLEMGRVWINDQQYFDNIPQVAWKFYIGGYQPAQKWLKDRRNRQLSFEDILHYQKIIVALAETDRLMKEIDKIEIE